jgi:glucose/arabinose dehydrogenase/PKD repeat protein
MPTTAAGPRSVPAAPASALLLPALLAWLLPAAPAAAQFVLPAQFQATALPGTYNLPVNITFTPDGGRIFLLEKPGVVRVLDGSTGAAQAQPFLDLTAEVNNDHDRGLLGIELHPGFVPDGGPASWVYLLYTASPVPGQDLGYNQGSKYSWSRLTRYRAVTAGGLIVADAASRHVLLGNQLPDGTVPDAIASVHNSHSNGSMHFADDGSLLLTTGDGAHYDLTDNGGKDNAAFDTFTIPSSGLKGPMPKVQDAGAFRSQDLRTLAGKVLRLDPATGNGYPSNPFFDGNPASNASRVWALGLRNPYRMTLLPGTGALDPSLGQPNALLIGDVGWNVWEEVDASRFGGENFGWPCFEGFLQNGSYQAYNPADPDKVSCHTPMAGTLTAPLVAVHHGNAGLLNPLAKYVDGSGNPIPAGFKGNCVIGGTIYAGGSYPLEYDGRLFFADYAQGWIRTMELDAALNVVAIRDFASATGNLVDIERHPVTGDLHVLSISTGQVIRISWAGNLSPVAKAGAAPAWGPAPLAVSFTGSASSDPEGGPLLYDWDFDDGSPHATVADPAHVYLADGVYHPALTVTDGGGATGTAVTQVAVGNGPPTAVIVSPLMAQVYQPPALLALHGAGSDPEGDALAFAWEVTLHHAEHVHPGAFLSSQQDDAFSIDVSPEDDELIYYRVQLTVTDPGGLSDSAHVFVYPQASFADVTGTALPIARVDELIPAGPTGGGNHDIEVLRDGVLPPVGSGDSALQYDTYHGGAQGLDDWTGFQLSAPPPGEFRWARLTFQEGKHFVDGGWFKDLRVEVRSNGAWSVAQNLHVTPAYPFALAGQAFFDGIGFQTYALAFDPQAGDAVRVRGTPGGSAKFLSFGELRAHGLVATPPSPYADLSAAATPIARVDSLVPPGPLGLGSKSKETIRNGTYPPVGSTSWLAQYDTLSSGVQPGDDWIGYDFGGARSVARIVFQEGRNDDGGAFTALHVERQQVAGGPWTTVPGLVVTPPYDGLDGVHYETFTLDFPTVTARAVRIAGPPAGAGQYISVGELRVLGPALPAGCGWFPYGAGAGPAHTLTLGSDTPPGLGLPVVVTASGAAGSGPGLLGLALGAGNLPVQGGTLLLDAATLSLFSVPFDATGLWTLGAMLPAEPVLEGASVWLQAFASGQPAPWPTRFSNGLRMTLCTW